MKFRAIRFNNYRCFLNGELEFKESEDRNINLILGTNGAGKTEMLFAFWWVLYGFNFKSLKNKEATPYSLNSSLYNEVKNGTREKAVCSVEVEIENDGTVYLVTRTAEFQKQGKHVTNKELQTVRYYKKNHELSLPISEENEVKKIIARIVPKAILNGIIFDGERMKQLSSVDETSVKAIAGVINDITNVELIEQCKLTFEQIQRKLNSEAKKVAKEAKNITLSALISEISDLQDKVNKQKHRKEEIDEELNSLQLQQQELELKLDDIKEAKHLEEDRKEAKEELENAERQKAELIRNFMVSINDGYLMCCGSLFDSVEGLLRNYDVPAELTVPAVDNILVRKTCICGNTWTPKMISVVQALRENLPPDNINSAIGEVIRQLRIQSEDKRKAVMSDFSSLQRINDSIQAQKDKISNLSAQIINSGSEEAQLIEKRYQKISSDIIELKAELRVLNDQLPIDERELEAKKKIKQSISKGKEDSNRIERQTAYVEKCIYALEQLNKVNRMTALKQINQRIQAAYQLLSDDYNLGRRIYIVQFDETRRYQIITYFDEKLQETLKTMAEQGTVKQLKNTGFTEEEITELAIINCAQSNSTGQSKMNTLAFVKSILDYARNPKGQDVFEIKREYPLLIDAPFGDIFEKNLERSASSLSSFTDQIILMLAKDSYDSVAEFINPHISTVHQLSKKKDEDHSSIMAIAKEAL